MWTCTKCGERIEESFDACWKCSTPRDDASPEPAGQPPEQVQWRLAYRIFRGTLATWDQLFQEAADFANRLGPERVLGISHSEDRDDGVVAVWYWTTDEPQD